MKSENEEFDIAGCLFVVVALVIIIGSLMWLNAKYPSVPCYAECRYSETYERCIAREDLTVEQCHDIALESVD